MPNQQITLPMLPLPPLPFVAPTPEIAGITAAGVEPFVTALGALIKMPMDMIAATVEGIGKGAEGVRTTVETILMAPITGLKGAAEVGAKPAAPATRIAGSGQEIVRPLPPVGRRIAGLV